MQERLSGIRYAVAIASNKGGVGKSTVAANLAVALDQAGFRVGLLDADVTGPNIPLMMGARGQPQALEGGRMRPLQSYGVKLMSIGFLTDETQAIIWRGPMIAHAVRQFLEQVEWGDLDYLIVDLPPGTSDASLSLAQLIPLTGVVIVTTPSDAALADVVRGIAMFRKINVPVLGVVENMSYFRCPHCGEPADIFGHGGGRRTAERLEAPFLGELPLEPQVRSAGDAGTPIVVKAPGSPLSEPFRQVALNIVAQVEAAAQRKAKQERPITLNIIPSPD